MFNVLIETEPTPTIAYTTNAQVNNTAIQVLKRVLPENIFNSLSCH